MSNESILREALEEIVGADLQLPEHIYDMIDAALAATAAPEQPKPVAWMDEFGNVFPLAAWKHPERASHHDVYKKPWKPLYLAAPPAPQQRDDKDAEYEIIQDDMQVAATSGPDAYREIMHYAAQYEQDGPLEIFKVVRTAIAAIPKDET